jgi:hypothetical protein
MKRATLTLFLTLGVAVSLPAQDAAPDAGRLALGTDTLAIFAIHGTDTTATGMVIDHLRTHQSGDRALLVRTYRSNDQLLGTRLDTIVDQFPTLAPVRHRSRATRGSERLDFDVDRDTGVLHLANGDSVTVDQALATRIINSSSFDVALRASPLAEGWSAEIPAFLPTIRAVVNLRARVAGVDSIAGATCWRVEAEFAGTPVTFWIEQSTRKLRQQLMVIRPDFRILFAQPRPAQSSRSAT